MPEEEEDFEPDFENEITIRAKWIIDGADTLDQAIAQIHRYADYLAGLKEEGWELAGMIGDDYGHLNAPPSVTDIDIKNKVSDTYHIYVLFMILILLYGLLVMYTLMCIEW